jgi:hypothetical protein
MKYDLSLPSDSAEFKKYVHKLITDQSKVELKKVSKPRTLSQFRYFHVVVGLWALEHGNTLEEAKTDLKREYKLFYKKNGNTYLISSASLDSKELSAFIDWIRDMAAMNGCYIPTAEEYNLNRFSIDKQLENDFLK